jgi:hypothetical protein
MALWTKAKLCDKACFGSKICQEHKLVLSKVDGADQKLLCVLYATCPELACGELVEPVEGISVKNSVNP